MLFKIDFAEYVLFPNDFFICPSKHTTHYIYLVFCILGAQHVSINCERSLWEREE